MFWAVVVAQLVELLLMIPEIRRSNPGIGKILSSNCLIEKTKIKKKRLGMPILKKMQATGDFLVSAYLHFERR